jgi:hypothetical protein
MEASQPIAVQTSPAAAQQAALRRLSAALQLQREARAAADAETFAFVAVNSTQTLIPYRQAVLLDAAGRVVALSGLSKVDRDAPFTVWAQAVFKRGQTTPTQLTPENVDGEQRVAWAEYFPAYALRVPLVRDGHTLATLILGRDEAFADAEVAGLDLAIDAYAHALDALAARGRWRIGRKSGRHGRTILVVLAIAALAAGFVPVRESALSPAEIVPVDAAIVRAGLDGVIDRVLVRPNQNVAAGELLALLDARRIDNQIDIARKAVETAEAELRQATQAAVFDPRARAAVTGLRGRAEQASSDLAYQIGLRERLEIRAPRAGVAVFDDAGDLVGRPIALGERLMLVADPGAVEIEMRLPVGDAIRLEPGAETLLFLNIDPQRPIAARLSFVAYRAQPGPDGALSYRLKARIDDAQSPERLRIGLKGTAKLYGQSVPLALYLFRRPLSALRQWVGQ